MKHIHIKVRELFYNAIQGYLHSNKQKVNIVMLAKHFIFRVRKKWIQILTPLDTMSNSSKPLKLSFLLSGNNNVHYI